MIGRKQSASHDDFLTAWHNIERLVDRATYENLLDRTVADLVQRARGRRVAFGWSGGKDSIALEAVCRRAGIRRCVFAMTNHLEYPAFLRWVTDHMPDGLEVVKNGWDLAWLSRHPEMLFPQSSRVAGMWFAGVQHAAQDVYFRKYDLDLLILGRRRADGNQTSPRAGRLCPIADWSHEAVLACLYYEGWTLDTLPPFYRWPRGFRCGTHAWPARQWCRSIADGWREVFSIEPAIVEEAAAVLPSAREFLRCAESGAFSGTSRAAALSPPSPPPPGREGPTAAASSGGTATATTTVPRRSRR